MSHDDDSLQIMFIMIVFMQLVVVLFPKNPAECWLEVDF